MPLVRVRLRRALPGTSPTKMPAVIVLRPALAITGVTKNAAGNVMPQALVKSFKTLTDVVSSREVSDELGRYTVSVFDTASYYAVGVQPATADASTVTADNTSLTADRMTAIGGVTDIALVGTT